MSQGFAKLFNAYLEAKETTPYLEGFFRRLALITGNYIVRDGVEMWGNRDGYPSNIHLAYLYLGYIANNHLDFIQAWHSRDNLQPNHFKIKQEPLKIGDYQVDPLLLTSIHPNFLESEWKQLLEIVEQVVKSNREARIVELQRQVNSQSRDVSFLLEYLPKAIENQEKIVKYALRYEEDDSLLDIEMAKLRTLQQEYYRLTEPHRELERLLAERNTPIEN
jgi:hypothetical protein